MVKDVSRMVWVTLKLGKPQFPAIISSGEMRKTVGMGMFLLAGMEW